MNPPDVTSGQIIFFILLIFGLMAVYPFAKAFLIYISTRLLKFHSPSYWKSFFCVLIGIGVTMAIQMVIMGLEFRSIDELDPKAFSGANFVTMMLGMILTPIAEAVSLILFFKESPGKTIGAVIITYLLAIVLLIALILLIFVAYFLIDGIFG